MSRVAPDSWKLLYFNRIKDLIDNYQPDLLYTDGGIPFDDLGYKVVSHYYNTNARLHGGKVEAVYTSKTRTQCAEGTCVFDIERGVANQIMPNAWQTDTCIGNWHYKRGITYKTPKVVVDMLCDIVSRNGNLMLNFPLPNSGELDAEELKILDEITWWMAVNSEGIYATRPWKIFGDGLRPRRQVQRDEPQGFHGRRSALHDQGQHAICVRDGLAGEAARDQASGDDKQRGAHKGQACGADGLQRQGKVDPGREGSYRADAGAEAQRSRDWV